MSNLEIKSLPVGHRSEPIRVGRRLRGLRLKRHLTVAQVADASGLSKGFVSRVEREHTSPSVASLISLCQVLGVSPGSVLEQPETIIVRAADAPLVDLGDEGIVESLLTPTHQRSSQILRSEIQPGGRAGTNMYIMDCDIESVHVVKGEITLTTADQDDVLYPGDTATLSGDEPHSWRNDSTSEAVVLWILTRKFDS